MTGKFKFNLREKLRNFESSSVLPSKENFSPNISPAQIAHNGNPLLPIEDIRVNDNLDNNVTSTVSAVISAVLALVILLLAFFIIQALKRWRRERQGSRFDQPVVLAIAPPAFAPITAAYTSRSGFSSGNLSWENVTSSTAPVLLPIQRNGNNSSQHLPATDTIITSPSSSASSSNIMSLPSSSSYL